MVSGPMKITAALTMVLILALAAYFSLWPVPIAPVSWAAPIPPGFTGKHAVNSRLAGLHQIPLNGEVGPEHVVIGPDGHLYAAVAGGRIIRMQANGAGQHVTLGNQRRTLTEALRLCGSFAAGDVQVTTR